MGDIVTIDEEGFIYVVDRLKELIKYKVRHNGFAINENRERH